MKITWFRLAQCIKRPICWEISASLRWVHTVWVEKHTAFIIQGYHGTKNMLQPTCSDINHHIYHHIYLDQNCFPFLLSFPFLSISKHILYLQQNITNAINQLISQYILLPIEGRKCACWCKRQKKSPFFAFFNSSSGELWPRKTGFKIKLVSVQYFQMVYTLFIDTLRVYVCARMGVAGSRLMICMWTSTGTSWRKPPVAAQSPVTNQPADPSQGQRLRSLFSQCVVMSLSLMQNPCTVISVPSQIFIDHDSHVPGWSSLSERRLSCLSSPFISPLSCYCSLDKMGKQASSNPRNN